MGGGGGGGLMDNQGFYQSGYDHTATRRRLQVTWRTAQKKTSRPKLDNQRKEAFFKDYAAKTRSSSQSRRSGRQIVPNPANSKDNSAQHTSTSKLSLSGFHESPCDLQNSFTCTSSTRTSHVKKGKEFNPIKIVHMNAFSLKNKYVELREYLYDNDIDVCAITKTYGLTDSSQLKL